MSLTAWDAALALAANRRVRVVYETDSTGAGQTRDNDTAGHRYSPATRLRERFQVAGIPDGGHGPLNGTYDTSDVSGEPGDAGVLLEPAYDVNNGQCLQANYTGIYTTAGKTYQAAGYGTRVEVPLAKYAGSVVEINVDGTSVQVAVPAKATSGSGADYNWQAGFSWVKTGLANGRHVVTVTLISGWMSTLVSVTRNTGTVIENYGSRGRKAVDTPWHQYQAWFGLTVTGTDPGLPASGSIADGVTPASLLLYGKGGNDKQGFGSTDTSAAYRAKAEQACELAQAAGGSAVILSPWWDSFNQPQLSDAFFAASQLAASNSGALWLDLGPDGALAGHMGEDIGGANVNPHLTALGYRYHGDYIANALLANYAGPVDTGIIPGRTILGYRIGGQERALVEFRRPA